MAQEDADGALRISPSDAERLGVADGGRARVTTDARSAEVAVEVTDTLQPGHARCRTGSGSTTLDERRQDDRPGVHGLHEELDDLMYDTATGLWMPVLVAVRRNAWLRAYYTRLREAGRPPSSHSLPRCGSCSHAIYQLRQGVPERDIAKSNTRLDLA